jgi:predicted nuclease of restriction endonuclease-like (RecB) superfamily
MKKLPTVLPDGYQDLLAALKNKIRAAQGRAGLAVNRELILLYWQIGKQILELQETKGWGGKAIEQLSSDLQQEFVGVQGFSLRNMQYMRKLAQQYSNEQIVQQVVAQLPWSHNITLLDKFDDNETRIWYAQKAIEHGWSRSILIHQIESKLHNREAKALTNFATTLPAPQSELAQKVLKDPYIFDFLSLGPEALEADVERGLIEHMKKFLLEMGAGFSFVGSQFHLEVGGQDYYIDLLFYHLRLRCYVVIDLKIGEFIPEYAGKMNFYLAAVDDHHKHIDDQPSIGIIMCKTANSVVTRYALRNVERPIGVAEYKLTEALPDKLMEELPTPEAIKKEFQAGAVSLVDEFAKENLELIHENGLLLETALLLLACLKDTAKIVHFDEPQRMALHFNKRTKQVYLHDFLLDKFVVLENRKIRHATKEEHDALRRAEFGPEATETTTESIEIDVEIVDVEKKILESDRQKQRATEYESLHKVYRQADLEQPEFIAAVAEASDLWKKECEDYLAEHGDLGSCVRGEGIKIRYLPPRKRKWVEETIIWPTKALNRVVGSLVWEHSATKIVAFLQAKGVDAFFDFGSLD